MKKLLAWVLAAAMCLLPVLGMAAEEQTVTKLSLGLGDMFQVYTDKERIEAINKVLEELTLEIRYAENAGAPMLDLRLVAGGESMMDAVMVADFTGNMDIRTSLLPGKVLRVSSADLMKAMNSSTLDTQAALQLASVFAAYQAEAQAYVEANGGIATTTEESVAATATRDASVKKTAVVLKGEQVKDLMEIASKSFYGNADTRKLFAQMSNQSEEDVAEALGQMQAAIENAQIPEGNLLTAASYSDAEEKLVGLDLTVGKEVADFPFIVEGAYDHLTEGTKVSDTVHGVITAEDQSSTDVSIAVVSDKPDENNTMDSVKVKLQGMRDGASNGSIKFGWTMDTKVDGAVTTTDTVIDYSGMPSTSSSSMMNVGGSGSFELKVAGRDDQITQEAQVTLNVMGMNLLRAKTITAKEAFVAPAFAEGEVIDLMNMTEEQGAALMKELEANMQILGPKLLQKLPPELVEMLNNM